MADVITTFDGDGKPLENVLSRLASQFEKFGKKAKSSSLDAQEGMQALTKSAREYGKALDENAAKAKKFESASKTVSPKAGPMAVRFLEPKAPPTSAEFLSKSVKNYELLAGAMGSATQSGKGFRSVMDGLNSLPDLPSLRYALYDIKNTFDRIAKTAASFALVPIGFAIKYEREFANVVRTNELAGKDMEDVRNKLESELRKITQLTPISWADITEIATLAGQLNIAQESLANFTEVTAKFAATTNLTVEGAATAFGRLNQLIKGVDGNFEGLGSAILAVGVSSVSTESEIVNVSTQIASMGNLAGLTAQEIIGLSGAMASLGIKPELARGTVTRLFSQIGKSAAEGGFKLEEFGRLTGRTAEQFASDWGTRPGQVLQDFFNGINNEGPKAERTLRQLGITSVRDIPAILRLAQNSDEVSRLIALSTEEYLKATKVSEQYGIISGTTAEQIKRLSQNFELLQGTIGRSYGALAILFQSLNTVVQGMTAIAEIPVLGQLIQGIVVVLSLLVAAFATVVAAIAGVIAGFIAMRFASRQLGFSVVDLIGALRGKEAALKAIAASGTVATASLRALSVVMKGMLIFAAISIVFTLISAAVGSFTSASDKAKESVEKFHGSLEGLSTAIEEDTKNFDKLTGKMKDGTDAITTFEKEVEESTTTLADGAKVFGDYIYGQEQTKDSVDKTTEAIEKQTKAVGENTLAYLQKKALEQPELIEFFSDEELRSTFEELGGDINESLVASLTGGQQPLLDEIVKNAKDAISVLRDERRKLANAKEYDDPRYKEIGEEIALYNSVIKMVNGTLGEFLDSNTEAVDAISKVDSFQTYLNGTLEDAARKMSIARQELDLINQELFGSARYTSRAEDALDKYAVALETTGASANDASAEIGDVISAILAEPDGDVDIMLGNLVGLLETLQAEGPVTASAQELVRATIERVGQEAGLTAEEIAALTSAMGTMSRAPLGSLSKMKSAVIELGEAFATLSGPAIVASEQMGAAIDAIISAAGDDSEKAINGIDGFYEAVVNGGLLSEQQLIALKERIIETYRTAAIARQELLREEMSAVSAGGLRSVQDIQRLRELRIQYNASIDSVRRITALLEKAGTNTEEASKYAALLKKGYEGAAKAAGKTAQETAKVAEEIEVARRTVVDFANDLRSVFQRATEIRFGRMLGMDRLTDAWKSLKDGVDSARQAIEKLIQTQRELSADRAIKEYFLSVATAYGDTLRAAKLREELAELDKKQLENSKELSEALERSSGDLRGNTEAARKNRQELTNLLGNYQDYISTLAATGAKKKELQAATNQARVDFIKQATELGFQIPVVFEYAQAFDDLFAIISRFKSGVNVGFNLKRGIGRQALREFNATRSYSSGGYTGPGGKFEIAGTVHKGEYVVPRELVNQSTGLPVFLDQMREMPGYGGGRAATQASVNFPEAMMVELSPYDRKLLAEAGNVQLRLNGKVVAEATNANNLMDARRGTS